MRIEWERTTIGQVLAGDGGSVKTGPFGTVLKAKEYGRVGVPLISVGEVGYGSLRVDERTPRAPREVVERLPEYVLRAGDIVFGRKGAVDRSAMVSAEQDGWFLGSDGIRLRLPSSIESRFMAYQIQSPQIRSWLIQHATGTTMASLNQAIIERVPIVLPPFPEQRAIAHILGTLDDKIELNRKMNETLEAMARVLFQSWFVDFDPVRAKAEGRDPCLPPHLADLFPDSFEDSELGEIPAGWEIRSLDQVATYLNGLALQKYPPEGEEWLPVIKIAQLRAGHSGGADRASANVPSAYVVHDGDVLFSWSGSLEVEIWSGGPGALNQHLFKVTSQQFPKWFYYFWTREHLSEFRSIAAGKATTMGHIQRGHLTAAKALVPPGPLLDAMDLVISPLIDRVLTAKLQSRTLAALRDGLLPRLISGELRVPASESFVERAV